MRSRWWCCACSPLPATSGANRLGSAISDAGVWLAFLVALGATVGSLYFSEVANFNPCRFCWFQRIAMYPLTVILLVGGLRKDPNVRWYAAPLAAIGVAISGWHSLIEWRPSLDNGECEFQGPSCTFIWFREFGLSLANMALIGFLTILILLLVRFPARLGTSDRARNGARPVKNRTVIIVVGVIVLVLGLAGAAVLLSGGDDESSGGVLAPGETTAPPTATTCRRLAPSR